MPAIRSTLKRAAAKALGNRLAFAASDAIVKRSHFPFVRVVGYHDTPAALARNFETHLQWYADNYVDCDRATLDGFLTSGRWPHDKPGLIISFDDGLRSNAVTAAPLLERFGFTGWFMVPAIVPDLDETQDRQFADDALIPHAHESNHGRLFMSWDELRALTARGHEICCHSLNHKRLGDSLTACELVEEIALSKTIFEARLGREIDCFAWVGGEDHSFSRAAFETMRQAGYRKIFSTNCAPILPGQTPLCLERNHVDARFDLDELRLSVGGLYDRLYRRKRRRINRLTGVERVSPKT